MKKFVALAFAALFVAMPAYGQNSGNVSDHAFAIGQGPTKAGFRSLLCASAQVAVGQAAADPLCRTLSGDATLSAAGVVTLATVNAGVGTFGSTTQCITATVNAKGLITAVSQAACAPPIGNVTGLGTGVVAALGTNIGSAGAPVLFNGAGGTPSSLTLTNASGLPIAGISGLGAGCGTFLGTPSSANLRGCLTDETGTGLAYFQGGDIGTPSAGNGSNLTSLNAGNISTGNLSVNRLNGGTGAAATTFWRGDGTWTRPYLDAVTNALGANVALNNTANYFIGPTVSQGSSGTWVASGVVSVSDGTVANALFLCKLWDGTTVASSAALVQPSLAANIASVSMSGIFVNPPGNIRIECRCTNSTTAVMNFNASGNSKDSTLTVVRIQ